MRKKRRNNKKEEEEVKEGIKWEMESSDLLSHKKSREGIEHNKKIEVQHPNHNKEQRL